jgi:hypothetical protein
MEKWLMLQNLYDGLTPMSKEHIDAATGGAFLSLTIDEATTLIDKMVTNHGWVRSKASPHNKKTCIP